MRDLVAWMGLYFAAAFLFSNIAEVAQGSGYLLALGIVGCAAATIAFTRDPLDQLVVRASALFLLAFFAYFLLRLAIDFGSIEPVWAVTMGTSGGILFAFGFGLSIAVLLFGVSCGRSQKLTTLTAIGYYALCLLLAYSAFSHHLSYLSGNLFVASHIADAYQRPGDLIVITALISSVLYLLVYQGHLLPSVLIFGMHLVLMVILIALSQLIGSNTGLVVTLGLSIALVLWRLIVNNRSFEQAAIPINGRMSVFRVMWRLAPPLVLHLIWVTIAAIFVFVGLLRWAGLEIWHLRIFGDAQGSLGGESFASRMRILHGDFIDQLSVAPAFGYLKAEQVVTGVGLYAHSLVSVASHLGLFGAALFLAYLIASNRELLCVVDEPKSVLNAPQGKLLRLFLLYIIIGFAFVGTFFTWMPLWFAFGLLLAPLEMEKA